MPKLVVQNLPPDSAKDQNKNIDATAGLCSSTPMVSIDRAPKLKSSLLSKTRNRETNSRVHTSLPTSFSAPPTPEIFSLDLFFLFYHNKTILAQTPSASICDSIFHIDLSAISFHKLYMCVTGTTYNLVLSRIVDIRDSGNSTHIFGWFRVDLELSLFICCYPNSKNIEWVIYLCLNLLFFSSFIHFLKK